MAIVFWFCGVCLFTSFCFLFVFRSRCMAWFLIYGMSESSFAWVRVLLFCGFCSSVGSTLVFRC